MKYLVVLLLGVASGMAATVGFIYFNPASSSEIVSPLMLSDRRQFILNYSAAAADAILLTNDGMSRTQPVPRKVAQLWEPTIRDTEILVTEIFDYRGLPIGVGIKFSSPSEETKLLNSEVIVNSAWHIQLPQKGTLFIAQRENHWNYLRDIVIPAHWSSSDSWKGKWRGLMSAGPNALGIAVVRGGSGAYAGKNLEAVEYLDAKAYSAKTGPVAADGQLVIEFPEAAEKVAAGSETR